MTQMHFKFNTHKWIEEKKEKQATKALKHDLLTVGITTIQMHSKIWKCSFFVLTINFEWIKSPHNDNNTTQTNFKNNSLKWFHTCMCFLVHHFLVLCEWTSDKKWYNQISGQWTSYPPYPLELWKDSKCILSSIYFTYCLDRKYHCSRFVDISLKIIEGMRNSNTQNMDALKSEFCV